MSPRSSPTAPPCEDREPLHGNLPEPFASFPIWVGCFIPQNPFPLSIKQGQQLSVGIKRPRAAVRGCARRGGLCSPAAEDRVRTPALYPRAEPARSWGPRSSQADTIQIISNPDLIQTVTIQNTQLCPGGWGRGKQSPRGSR